MMTAQKGFDSLPLFLRQDRSSLSFFSRHAILRFTLHRFQYGVGTRLADFFSILLKPFLARSPAEDFDKLGQASNFYGVVSLSVDGQEVLDHA